MYPASHVLKKLIFYFLLKKLTHKSIRRKTIRLKTNLDAFAIAT